MTENNQAGRGDNQTLVCTVLPTYNEHENIEPLIHGVLASAITAHLVLVVDDNSPDGTGDVVERVAADYQTPARRVVLIRRVGEKGLTSAIQRGIDEAINTYHAAIVTWMDCDLSMPPQDIPKLVQPLLDDQADLVIGSRWIPGGADVAHGQMARTLSWLINHFAILLLGAQVHDYTSGFVAARAPLFQQIRLRGDYGEYCIDLLGRAGKAGYRLREVPYVCVPRTAGDSKTGANLWDYLVKGRNYVATIWRVRFG
ncbi:MAG: polyprenol monophosphomannose synthase [Caldilineaceae bacterium]